MLRRLALLTLLALGVGALTVGSAAAQATLVGGLPGTNGFGQNCLSPNDDGSSIAIDVTDIFPGGLQFFSDTHTEIFVNTNGNITFSGGITAYSPVPFPVADRPMIAPYWADVDVREVNNASSNTAWDGDNEGSPNDSDFEWRDDVGMAPSGVRCAQGFLDHSFSNVANANTGSCPQPSENGVYWHLDEANDRIVVTWHDVGYFNCRNNAKMSFQLILTRPSGCVTEGDFDVEFRFSECGWNTGVASGGDRDTGFPDEPLCGPGENPNDDDCSQPAQSGFDAGDQTNFFEIAGSRTNNIHTIMCTESNVGETGVWRFQVRAGVISCANAGQPCTVPGQQGVCAQGVFSCEGTGAEVCNPIASASAEICDNVDNDCDGVVDNADATGLCAGSQICSAGVCVGRCSEFGCPATLVCDSDDRCTDPACDGVSCPEGQRCDGGSCVDSCTGIVCPFGETCVTGRCVDLCDTITCDAACQVCDAGACETRCMDNGDCPSGEACQGDGTCVPAACDMVSCGAGTHCEGGSCVDDCIGVTCPLGQECSAGDCVAVSGNPDMGPGAGADMGTTGGGDGGTGSGVDSGTGSGVDSGTGRVVTSGGCGCRVATTDTGGVPAGLAALLLLGAAIRRRRARTSHRR